MAESYERTVAWRLRRYASVALFLILVCIGLFAAAFYAWHVNYVRPVYREVAAIERSLRTQGIPVTLEELDAYYPAVDERRNAAREYERGFALIEPLGLEPDNVKALYEAARDAAAKPETIDKEAIESVLAQAAPILDACTAAVQLREARFDAQLFRGLDSATSPHIKGLKMSIWLMALRGYHDLQMNEIDETVEDVFTILHMSESLKNEPTIVAHLMRLKAVEVSCRLTLAMLIRDIDLSDLALMDLIWDDVEIAEELHRALVGSRVGYVAALHDVLNETGLVRIDGVDYIPVYRHMPWQQISQKRHELMLYRECSVLQAILQKPYFDWMSHLTRASARWRRAPSTHYLVRELLSGDVLVFEYQLRAVAELRLLRLVLAVERYRLIHGDVPESLEQLVPEYLDAVPRDTYAEAPLGYRVCGNRYGVYSAYRNGVDDGGRRHGEEDGDWIFWMRR